MNDDITNGKHDPREQSIRHALRAAADGLELGVVEPTDVRRRASRRRRRRGIALAGGTAVVAVGVVGAIVSSNEPAEFATTPPTSSPATVPDDSIDPVPTTVAITAPATLPPITTTPPVRGAGVSVEAPADANQLLPWRDGFLAIEQVFEPQPLGELSDDLVELFPDEIRAVFPDGLPATIDEAAAALDEAGYLDEVTGIIADNPELSRAIYETPPARPELIARFTIDGVEWTEQPLVAPIDGYPQFSISGDRLVATSMDAPEGPDDRGTVRTFTLAITSDLTTWQTASHPLETPVDAHPAVRSDVYVRSVAVIGDRWVAAVDRAVMVDHLALLPDELSAEIDQSQGWSTSTGENGIEFEFTGFDGERTEVSLTWDELGLPGNPEAGLDQSPQSTLVVGDFTGPATETAGPIDSWFGDVISLGDRVLLSGQSGVFTSVDGITWSELDGLDPDHFFQSAVPLDGGHLLIGDGRDGSVGVIMRPDGSVDEVDLPELPDRYSLWSDGTSAAWIVELHDEPDMIPVTISVEHDGYRLTLTDGNGSTSWELADAGTGQTVLASDGDAKPDDLWQFDGDSQRASLVVVDPTTGDEIVRIPDEVFEPAFEAAYEEAYGDGALEMEEPYEPDLWLLATTNGSDWLVRDLGDPSPEGRFWPHTAAVNDGRVLYQTTDGWVIEPIG